MHHAVIRRSTQTSIPRQRVPVGLWPIFYVAWQQVTSPGGAGTTFSHTLQRHKQKAQCLPWTHQGLLPLRQRKAGLCGRTDPPGRRRCRSRRRRHPSRRPCKHVRQLLYSSFSHALQWCLSPRETAPFEIVGYERSLNMPLVDVR